MADNTIYEIELIIEDGRALYPANSYVSMEYADSYCMNRGYSDWLTQSQYVRKSAIIKAMDYVDNLFPWKGRKAYRNQSLSFPRVDIVDADGFDRSKEIPEQLKKAICEAAYYAYNQSSLYGKTDPSGPYKVTEDTEKTHKKADVAEIDKEVTIKRERKFFTSEDLPIDWTSAYQSLDKILNGLYEEKGVNHVCIPAVWRG